MNFPDVAPYLLRDDGVRRIPCDRTGERFYVDAVVDLWGKSLCTICVDNWFGCLHEKHPCFGLAYDSHPKVPANEEERARGKTEVHPRVWWYEVKLTDEERRTAYEYFADPRCTPERHAFYEASVLAMARTEAEATKRRLGEVERRLGEVAARRPGWSIAKETKKEGVHPFDSSCVHCTEKGGDVP